MMANEKPGGHGERSVAVGVLDMALWDAVAKAKRVPLWKLLADRYNGGKYDDKAWVYAAGGYYYPGKDLDGAAGRDEALSRPRLFLREDEGGRRAARRRPQAHRGGAEDRRRRRAAGGRRQRQVRPHHRDRVRQGDRGLWPALVRGAARSARLSRACRARDRVRPAAGDRREPVLDAGRAQPDPPRRAAARPRHPAVRSRRCPTAWSSTCARSTC